MLVRICFYVFSGTLCVCVCVCVCVCARALQYGGCQEASHRRRNSLLESVHVTAHPLMGQSRWTSSSAWDAGFRAYLVEDKPNGSGSPEVRASPPKAR